MKGIICWLFFLQADAAGNTTNHICGICGKNFVAGQTKQNHNRTKKHQAAFKELKKKKKEKTGSDLVLFVMTL
jgi:hypothetical protein